MMHAPDDDVSQPEIATIGVGERRFRVGVRILYDGVEYVGRLWFHEEEWDDGGLPDKGTIAGRSREEVLTLARRLTEDELVSRYRRAVANRRRYIALRHATDDFLHRVRYLNQVAISMRAGLIDVEGAAQELDSTEQQLHELVRRLRVAAGVEIEGFEES
jgi:hypothetical protein